MAGDTSRAGQQDCARVNQSEDVGVRPEARKSGAPPDRVREASGRTDVRAHRAGLARSGEAARLGQGFKRVAAIASRPPLCAGLRRGVQPPRQSVVGNPAGVWPRPDWTN